MKYRSVVTAALRDQPASLPVLRCGQPPAARERVAACRTRALGKPRTRSAMHGRILKPDYLRSLPSTGGTVNGNAVNIDLV
jgi:hypothetical protein